MTTSNLPWFTNLTFLVSMQYCSLQHQTLRSPLTHPAEWRFRVGPASSLFLELFLHSFPEAYWTPTYLRHSFSGFTSSPVGHVLSELSTMTHPSWVALHGMVHSFTELHKAVIHMIIWLFFCDCGFHSLSLLVDEDNEFVQVS